MRASSYLVHMKIETLNTDAGIFLPENTQAQVATIEKLDGGLCYPVQGKAANCRCLLPIWTDGDGGYFAISRDGSTFDL